ncbi:MAG: hypothetical protein PHU03_03005 [Syntrophales bacterium]|nr:hypothetical protein [Syntrophales bacterium]
MAESEFEKLVRKAKGFGIDVQVIIDEMDRRIDLKQTALARKIIDEVPQLKPDTEAIVQGVLEKVQTAQIDIDSVVNQVIEKIPDTGEVERKRAMADVAKQLSEFLGNMDKRIESMVRPLVDEEIKKNLDEMIKAVRAEMNNRMEEIAANFKGGGNGGGGGKWGNIPWDQITPIIETLVNKGQDPFAAVDQFLAMRDRFAALEPQGPGINQQLRVAGSAFTEGAKIAAKAFTRSTNDVKKALGPTGGPSSSQPVKSSGLHPAIRNL